MKLSDLEKNHFLFQMSNSELREMLVKPFEWSAQDVEYAKLLLKKRGASINLKEIELERDKVLAQLEEPDRIRFVWIILGYLSAGAGGLLGVIFGNIIWKSKKTLPTGEKIPRYSAKDRNHGENITYIGFTMLAIVSIAKLVHQFMK